jgi:hypothetical protein
LSGSANGEQAKTDRHPLRVAFEGRDFDGVAEALAPDVVLNSPITALFQFQGRDRVTELLGLVREVFEDLHYEAEFGDAESRAIVFRARVEGHELEGTDILRLDEEGRVREITVFVRPLPGLTALMAALAPRLAAERGRTRSIAAAGVRPVAALTRTVDRVGARLVGGHG